jgi:hypothetical protein
MGKPLVSKTVVFSSVEGKGGAPPYFQEGAREQFFRQVREWGFQSAKSVPLISTVKASPSVNRFANPSILGSSYLKK